MTPEEGYNEARRIITSAKRKGEIRLDISNLNLSEVPPELLYYKQLKALNLSANKISLIENIPDGIQELNLKGNQISRIENLPKSIHSLNLQWNQINEIENLHLGIKDLNLRKNKISQIEKGKLPSSLKILNLQENYIIRIEHLPKGLKDLRLWKNQIRQIENLPRGLKLLGLTENRISKIEKLPKSLIELNLNRNKIDIFENIPEGLKILNLQENKIKRIKELPLSLQELRMFDNPVENVPQNLLGENDDSNCISDVRAWFADLAHHRITNQTVRLLVTGNGYVGKSSLVEALQQDQCTTPFDSTHAIRVETLFLAGQKPVTCQVFDFGGQEIYMGTHQLFLRGRAVQLIVFDAEAEAILRVPDRITGEVIRNQPLRHWVHTVKQQSPDSRFVLTQNKMDLTVRADANTEALLAQYESKGMAVARVSATTGRGIAALRGHISEAAYALPEYGMEMPASWHRVRQYFIDNLHQPLAQRQRLMIRVDFDSLCHQHNVLPRSESALLTYLHRSGTVYYNTTYLPDTIIADQEWAITAIYAAIDRKEALYERLRNQSYGKCQVRDLFVAFGAEYGDEQRWLFLRFMESCGLCFPLKQKHYEATNEATYYIFPEFLPAETPEVVAEFIQHAGQSKRIFQQTLEFLPYAHIQQLISRWGLKTHMGNISRTAFYVRTTECHFALIADLQQHTLTLHVEMTPSDEWLNDLLKQFAYSNKEWQEITTPNAPQPVTLRPESESKIDVLAKTPDVVQPTVRKIFFSYSHKDEVYRDELETHLAMLKRTGRVTVWYDRKIIAGEEWNAEIERELWQADIVLPMISANLINSDYIWNNEFPIIRERRQKQDGIRIIPVFTKECDTEGLDFMELQGGQRDHQSELPWVSSSSNREEIYAGIVNEIKKAIHSMS